MNPSKNIKQPYKKHFLQILKIRYPETFHTVMEELDEKNVLLSKDIQFASKSDNPMDKRLNISAYYLALIQVLEKKGASYQEIQKICLEIAHSYVRPKNILHLYLKRIPAKIISLQMLTPFLKVLNRKLSKIDSTEGFKVRILTEKHETYGLGYGIDILECGICKLFQKHQAAHYVSILCEVDKITTQLAGLELLRTGTIANGAEKCDFRFKKTHPDSVS